MSVLRKTFYFAALLFLTMSYSNCSSPVGVSTGPSTIAQSYTSIGNPMDPHGYLGSKIAQGSPASLDNTEPAHAFGKYYNYLEAENALLSGPVQLLADIFASNGLYVRTTTNPNPTEENAEKNGAETSTQVIAFNISIDSNDYYSVWGRVLAPDSTQDSFYVTIDDYISSDTSYDIYDTNECHWGNSWVWTQVGASPDRTDWGPYGPGGVGCIKIFERIWYLQKGVHTIKFRKRENLSILDKILVTNDLNFVPNR